MQKQQKITLTVIISGLLIFSGVAIYLVSLESFTITQSNFDPKIGSEIEPDAQRLSIQLDVFQNQHFIYLLGERPRVEPNTLPYNGSHVLKYGTFVDDEIKVENVTDELVFPYHYDMRVDSLGQVHLAYVANNFTLYYTVRDPTTGTWVTTQLSTPSVLWTTSPAITLGADEQPRIVYPVTFKEDADLFFDQEGSELTGLSSLFYAVLDGSNWLYFDVGDNHSPSSFTQRDVTRQRIYNPGIKIEAGFAYIAFTNKVSLAVETRMQYLKIPEIPEDTDFLVKIHKRAKLGQQATTYRRPSIHLVGDGVLLAFGAWSIGAASVLLLANSSSLENPNALLSPLDWLKEELLPANKQNKQVDSITGIEDKNGVLYLTWSLYDLFNAETQSYSHDVFLASLNPTSTNIGAILVERVTDTTQVSHYTPSLTISDENILTIHYIRDNNGLYGLTSSVFGGIGEAFSNEGLGLVLSLGLLGLFTGLIIAVIQLIPKKVDEVVILPHMINLRDVITKD